MSLSVRGMWYNNSISYLLQLCLYLAPFPRYHQLFSDI